MSRGSRPVQPNTQPNVNSNETVSSPGSTEKRAPRKKIGLLHLGKGVLVFSTLILLLALMGAIFFGKGPASEFRSVDTTKMQAVFLNGGQVYFGRIAGINPQFMRVYDIYYLRVNQQVQPGQTASSNDVSLVKLGCELHGPTDIMVINREQVIFWENLKDDGQVAKAVAEYKKQNPDGQKCQEAQQSNTNSNTNQTNPTPTPTPTPPPATNTNTNRR